MLIPSVSNRPRAGALFFLLTAIVWSLSHSTETLARSDSALFQSEKGVRSFDVSGNWMWQESNKSMVPGYVAGFVGLEDEGPTLHVTCETHGTMSVTQSGNTFSGSAEQLQECFTQGGQGPFAIPGDPVLEISRGAITGTSIKFMFGNCLYRGHIVKNPQTYEVLAIAATGNCPEFFQPASFKTLSFVATR